MDRRLTFLTLLAAICTAQEPPRIEVNVHLVNVTFSVRNESGLAPANLTKDDFEVFEDGVRQNMSFFSRSADLPLTLGLIVDASGSQEHFVEGASSRLADLSERGFATAGSASSWWDSGTIIRLVSDFTSSSDEVLDDLKIYEHSSGKFDEIGPLGEDREGGTAFYDAIYYSAAEKLSNGTSGRKALVIFSDGEDNSSAHHMLDAIEEAQIENIPLFCIRYTEHGKHGRVTARNKYGTSVMARIAKESGGAGLRCARRKT